MYTVTILAHDLIIYECMLIAWAHNWFIYWMYTITVWAHSLIIYWMYTDAPASSLMQTWSVQKSRWPNPTLIPSTRPKPTWMTFTTRKLIDNVLNQSKVSPHHALQPHQCPLPGCTQVRNASTVRASIMTSPVAARVAGQQICKIGRIGTSRTPSYSLSSSAAHPIRQDLATAAHSAPAPR